MDQKILLKFPYNPFLAEPMYLAGYIEKFGTGTFYILKFAKEHNLKEPGFIQNFEFRTIIYWPSIFQATDQATDQATNQATERPNDLITRLILVADMDNTRQDLMDKMQLKQAPSFRESYLIPSMSTRFIEMSLPSTPNHPNQLYRLTSKGLDYKQIILSNHFKSDTPQVYQLIRAINGEMSRDEIQASLKLRDREHFRKLYLNEALKSGLIEMTLPDKPNSRYQKYRLTSKGKILKIKTIF